MKKDVFVDGHEQPDVVEDREQFLKTMKELEPYLVEFEEDGTMKAKNYLSDCKVGGNERRPIIIITHDECMFSLNDGICKVWIQIGNTFLRPKGRGQEIMVSEFLFPFERLNLFSLPEDKKKEVMKKVEIIITKAVLLVFEYGKANKEYWDGPKLHQQVINKALPIAEALYQSYSFLFLFDNITSHLVYAQDVLCTTQMNKRVGVKQPWLRNGWFEQDGVCITQLMFFQKADGILVQKRV